MIIKIGKRKFGLKVVILVAIMIILIGFILGNLFLVIDYNSAPKFAQKIVISETDFVNKIIDKFYYRGEVYREGSGCGS
jgi:hypothetical protein